MFKLSLLLAVFLYSISGFSSVCADAVGSCDFYQCLDQTFPCGDKGYALHFGHKFCTKSDTQLFNRMQTEQGKQWVLDTMKCLQQALSERLDIEALSCQKIQDIGYQTHMNCYIQSGYCELPGQDKKEIIKLLKFQLLKPKNIIQGIHLLQACKK